MKRATIYVVLGVVVVAVVGAVIWQPWLTREPEEETRATVVERGMLVVTVSASGSIEPEAQVALSFDVPGRVTEVLVEVGEGVQAGDPLARVDSEQLALQVQQAEAVLEAAQAQLALLKAGPRPEEIAATEASLRAAQAQVSTAAANRDQLEGGASDAQIAAAEAQVASAMAQQKVAQDTHDMTMKCVTITMPDGKEREICPALGTPEEQARYSLHAADEALAAAQAQLDELLAGADADQVRAARASVWAAAAQQDAMQAQLDLALAGASEEQVAVTEAQVAQAQAALDMAELALERATLCAPFDGLVAVVNVTVGQMAGGGLPAVMLVDNSRFHVSVQVDEVDVAELAEGQPVEVTLDALPDVVLSGMVERIAPAAAGMAASAGTGVAAPGVVSYDMTIVLDPTDAPVRAGMSANATVMVEELADVLLIPTWVVRIDRRTGQTYVQRQAGEQTERVDVQLGVRGNGVVQVLGGLGEGDVVVLIQKEMFEAIMEEMQ